MSPLLRTTKQYTLPPLRMTLAYLRPHSMVRVPGYLALTLATHSSISASRPSLLGAILLTVGVMGVRECRSLLRQNQRTPSRSLISEHLDRDPQPRGAFTRARVTV